MQLGACRQQYGRRVGYRNGNCSPGAAAVCGILPRPLCSGSGVADYCNATETAGRSAAAGHTDSVRRVTVVCGEQVRNRITRI